MEDYQDIKQKFQQGYQPQFMERAVVLSRSAYQSGKGLPIGCVIVKDGMIVGEGHNEIFLRNNPTSHGEMVAIENACQQSGQLLLEGCELYTTLEPCPMCLSAIYWAKIKMVYFACSNEDATKVGFDDSFIFEELRKTPRERKVQTMAVPLERAFEILKEWQLQDMNAAQPWQRIQ